MKAVSLLLAATIAWLAGCAAKPTGGTVVGPTTTGFGALPAERNVTFVAANGQMSTLNAVRQPLAILGFVPTAGACDQVAPEMTRLSGQFLRLPVSIVQVSEPTQPCPHPQCTQVGEVSSPSLLVLCDPGRTAASVYGNAPPGTLLLIDGAGNIVAWGTLDSPGPVIAAADQMGRNVFYEHQATN